MSKCKRSCGCGCNSTVVMPYNGYGNGCGNGFGNDGILWIIILLAFCGNGNGFGCGNGCDDGCGDNNFIWLLLIIILAGGCGSGYGNGFGF